MYARLDVSFGRERVRITANVDVVRVLIYADPVDTHRRGEHKIVVVDETEVLGKPQVDDEVLSVRSLVKYVFYNRLQNVP